MTRTSAQSASSRSDGHSASGSRSGSKRRASSGSSETSDRSAGGSSGGDAGALSRSSSGVRRSKSEGGNQAPRADDSRNQQEEPSEEDRLAIKEERRRKNNERRRIKRAENRLREKLAQAMHAAQAERAAKVADAAAATAAAAATGAKFDGGRVRKDGSEKLPPYRVPITGPGVGWQQSAQYSDREDVSSLGQSPAAAAATNVVGGRGSSPSRATAMTVAAAADALAAKIANGTMRATEEHASGDGDVIAGGGGGERAAGAGSRGGSSAGGPLAVPAGARAGGMGRDGVPMDDASIQALLADSAKSKILVNNLLAERLKEVDLARRKRDALEEQRRRLERDRVRAQERHKATMERKHQPVLPIDDSLLHTLPPPEEGSASERPRFLKKLSIAADVAGPILRAWDFLHTTAQAITLSPFGLDDFADALHFSGGPSVMIAEVHTRLLSVILRDGKFPKSLRERLESAATEASSGATPGSGKGLSSSGKPSSSKQLTASSTGGGGGSGGGGSGGSSVTKKGKGSASRAHHKRRLSGGALSVMGGRAGFEEDEEDEERESLLTSLLPPRSERYEHHENAYNLVTPLTWQTVFALALPHMVPYTRATAASSPDPIPASLAATPAGVAGSKRGSSVAIQAAIRVEVERAARGRALVRARRSLLQREYCSLSLQEKVFLLEVLIDTAYETKRIRSVLEENMRARTTLESQRREEIIIYNRELRERATAQKTKVHARLRKVNEEQYRRRVIDAEKAAAEKAKAVAVGTVASGASNGSAAASSASPAAGDGVDGSGSGNGSAAQGSGSGQASAAGVTDAGDATADGTVAVGSSSKSKGKSKKGKGKATDEAETGAVPASLLKVNPKIYEPDRTQLQAGIAEDTVQEAVGGPFQIRPIVIPEDDVDPTEAEEEEAERARKKVMLENLSRQELIKRRREMDAKEKDRARRRQEWKDSRAHRLQQTRALQSLKAATADGDVDMLEEALKEAKKASLEEDDHDGTHFLSPEMRDAYLALASAKERLGRTKILDKYDSLMDEKFVRTEPLGVDRHGNRYWVFEGDARIHVEVVTRKPDAPKPAVVDTFDADVKPSKSAKSSKAASAGSAGSAIDAESMIIVDDQDGVGRTGASARGRLSDASASNEAWSSSTSSGVGTGDPELPKRPRHPPAEHYHPVWSQSLWAYYDTEEEIHNLILSLDVRGKREAELRQALLDRYDMAELERSVKERSVSSTEDQVVWREEGSEFLGKRVKRVFGRRVAGAEVVKWVPAEDNGGTAYWHVRHDDGDEEDLEEDEVREGMAMAQAEEKHASGSGATVSALVKAAVDGSLSQTFSEYANRLHKMQAIKPRDLGLGALQDTLLHREAGMLEDIRDRSREYSKGSDTASPRGKWLRLVRDASGVSDLKEAILMLEQTLRGLQSGEDKVEGGRMEMEAKGWSFNPDAHPFIGRRCRRFFKEYGKSNCTVVGHLPSKGVDDPELWHVIHDDGDAEDVEEHELEKAARYYEEGIEEQPDSDEDEDEDGSHEENGGGRGGGVHRERENGDRDREDDQDDEDDDEDEEDVDMIEANSSPTQHRPTLWENWGARQGWMKGVKAASTVAALALGFLTLVETAYLFGIGKESMLEANRSRARMAKAWETPGKVGKAGKRAAAVAASAAISNFAEMDAEDGQLSPSATTGAGGASGGGSGGKRRSSRETGGSSSGGAGGGGGGGGSSGGGASGGSEGSGSKTSNKRQRR